MKRRNFSQNLSTVNFSKVYRNIWLGNTIINFVIKGYLCYQTITSQNVSSEAQVKNYFILWKNYVPFSRYSGFKPSHDLPNL